MGEAIRVLGREADDAQQLVNARTPLLAAAAIVDHERLADDVADGHARVERCVRVLEDDLHLAANVAQLPPRQVRDVTTVELDLARRRISQPDQRAREGRLATPGLADEPERLPGVDRQIDAVDGMDVPDRALHDPGADREMLVEVFDAEDLLAALGPLVDARGRLGAHATASENLDLRPISSSEKWHALSCPAPSTGFSGGTSCLQRSRARKHRGWNGQPGGRLMSEGGAPVMGSSHSSSPGQLRQAVHEPDRVGMPRRSEDVLDGARLDDVSRVHHEDAVAHLGHDPQVVRDQDDRGLGLLLDALEDFEDLRLDRHVERRGRLVGDQESMASWRSPWRSSRAGACRRRTRADTAM